MFWTVTLSILQGCSQAVKLFFLTLLFALPLGLVVAFGSMSKWAPSGLWPTDSRKCGALPAGSPSSGPCLP